MSLCSASSGEYEGLREVVATDPTRAPDFGPSTLGSAGAVAIGARPPLVAFNVYLNSSDVKPAQAIARAVRHSNGGFRFVKALGLIVEGQAQVSMNLTDYRKTPIHRVLETIRSEAAFYGLRVTRTEIVGLLPSEALIDSARFYLQLDGFSPEQVLENRLFGDE